MKKTLEMEFKLDDDKSKTISLSDPKDDLTLASVTPWPTMSLRRRRLSSMARSPSR